MAATKQHQPKKTLVLQLARLGDIFQTWPALNALKRLEPDAELHLLTRAAFSSAAKTMSSVTSSVDRYWTFETKAIIAPLVEERADIDLALAKLGEIVESLKAEKFDKIVNLTFSDFSASLVKAISQEETEVRGYTRFDDGLLSITDDSSAYFFGQVGPGNGNRLHITDLFASVAGVDLTSNDWEFTEKPQGVTCPIVNEAGKDSILVHIGASDLAKTLSVSKWKHVIEGLLQKTQSQVILVGSKDEMDLANRIADVATHRKPLNFVGRTTISEVFEIVRGARLVIGGDSAPVQMASMTNTRVLNLSFPMVSCWETGPRATGSRVLLMENEDSYSADEIVREAVSMITGRSPFAPVLRVPERNLPYIETRPQPQAFEWKLMQALYMGESFPEPQNEMFYLAAQRLQEVNYLALEQLSILKKSPTDQSAAAFLDRADEVMDTIVKLVPEAGVIVRWFRVERSRFGPMAVADLVSKTKSLHSRLGEVLSLYASTGDRHDNVGLDKI
jgi:heptosyltransferase III